MKKILSIMLLMILFITGCGKKESAQKEEKKVTEDTFLTSLGELDMEIYRNVKGYKGFRFYIITGMELNEKNFNVRLGTSSVPSATFQKFENLPQKNIGNCYMVDVRIRIQSDIVEEVKEVIIEANGKTFTANPGKIILNGKVEKNRMENGLYFLENDNFTGYKTPNKGGNIIIKNLDFETDKSVYVTKVSLDEEDMLLSASVYSTAKGLVSKRDEVWNMKKPIRINPGENFSPVFQIINRTLASKSPLYMSNRNLTFHYDTSNSKDNKITMQYYISRNKPQKCLEIMLEKEFGREFIEKEFHTSPIN